MKRTTLKRNRSLRLLSQNDTPKIKRRIQALLREIVIRRDGGCIFRVVLGSCSGPLQAEHLNTRARVATFGDTRNVVCLCQYHHIFWKPQHSRYYWELIEQHIGKKLWEWLKRAEQDTKSYRFYKSDWLMVEAALQKELEALGDKGIA